MLRTYIREHWSASRLWWQLLHRFHPRHRYNVIKTTLRPGYYDPCVQLLSAVFDMTQKFFDDTRVVIAWDTDTGHQEAYQVFLDATAFWKRYKRALQYGQFRDLLEEQELQKQALEHMQAILRYRDYMWYP